MVKVDDIYKYIDNFAPFNTAMDFDNCGMLICDKDSVVERVMLCLDVTDSVINEAININANLIISHHPVIFKPIKNIQNDSIVYKLIENKINVICAHTNLDMSSVLGVNTCLADALELFSLSPLSIYKSTSYNKIIVYSPSESSDLIRRKMSEAGAGELGNYSNCSFTFSGEGRFTPMNNANPYIGKINECETVCEDCIQMICKKSDTYNVIKAMKSVHPYEVPAFDIFEDLALRDDTVLGLIGSTKKEFSFDEFALYVKEKLNANGARYLKGSNKINRVAVSSGAGGNLIEQAINLNADAFVTGEIKHHELLQAQKHNITVVDVGHFASEDVVILPLLKKLSDNFKNIEFIKAKSLKDFLFYI